MKTFWRITVVLLVGLLAPGVVTLGEADRCIAMSGEEAYGQAVVSCSAAAEHGNEQVEPDPGGTYELNKGVQQGEVKADTESEILESEGGKDAGQKLALLEQRLTPAQYEEAMRLSEKIGRKPLESASAGLPAGDGLQAGERFSGKGARLTPEFFLPEGLYVVKMQHSGENNFIILPGSMDEQHYLPLANVIGSFEGSTVFLCDEAKTYKLNVNADGAWNVDIERPNKGGSRREFAGKGQQVTKLITLEDGVYAFGMKHDGSSNFSVRPYSALGEGYVSLANVIGPFDGSRIRPFSEGDYLFQVDADGDWELSITQQ